MWHDLVHSREHHLSRISPPRSPEENHASKCRLTTGILLYCLDYCIVSWTHGRFGAEIIHYIGHNSSKAENPPTPYLRLYCSKLMIPLLRLFSDNGKSKDGIASFEFQHDLAGGPLGEENKSEDNWRWGSMSFLRGSAGSSVVVVGSPPTPHGCWHCAPYLATAWAIHTMCLLHFL
ncbi:hypothetical protein BJX64DRAFT_129206 [Aspergillus heterothallicus]